MELLFTDKKSKTWLKKLLSKEGAIVTFTKKDGTERVMKATLNENVIPQEFIPKSKDNRKINDEVIAVFDLENQGWRSFRYDSIKQVEVVLGGVK
jgi:hypothetical protein